MNKFIFLICFSLININTKAQGLNATEQKIIDFVNQHMTATTNLLKETVDINSGTLNIEGVKKVGAVYGKELEKAGLKATWISLPDSLHRAGHLVAYKKGKKGKKVFIIGHLDTVFEPDMLANPWKILNDSTATDKVPMI